MDWTDIFAAAFIAAAVVLLVTVVATVLLGLRLWRRRALLTGPDAPLGAKLIFWGAILYVVSPLDLLPDPILLDDILVLLIGTAGALSLARRSATRPAATPAPRAEEPGRPGTDQVQDVPDWPGHPSHPNAVQDRLGTPHG